MIKKSYRIKPRFFIILTVLGLCLMSYFLISKIDYKKSEVKTPQNMKKYALIDNGKVYFIYEDLVFKIPEELYFTKKKSLKEILIKKKYKELVNMANYIFPEKLEGYKMGSYKKLNDFDLINLPVIKTKDKIYLKSSALNEIFVIDYYKINEERKNVIIDILNANGVNGYASKIGENIKKNLLYEYNAANYEKISGYSYIVENRLSKKQLRKIAQLLDEKYIKIKNDTLVPTISDAVIVLGNEKVNDFFITIISNEEKDAVKDILSKEGYKKIGLKKPDIEIAETEIRYNEEDYYIAYKISKILKWNNLIQDNSLNNNIEIRIQGGNI